MEGPRELSLAQSTVAVDGFEIADLGLATPEIDAPRVAVTTILADHQDRGGVRNVARRLPDLIPLITGPLKALVRPHFGGEPFAVRVLLFDKTPVSNWRVAWHQDVTIAVARCREMDGWGPWSRKDGVWHVRAPLSVLAGMLTARLHLDPCGAANGPVRVIPGSHRLGRLSDSGMEEVVRDAVPIDCLVPAGGVLLMRPLTVHSSAPSASPAHRRVLHVEFAGEPLPDGLEWAERDGRSVLTDAAAVPG